MTESKETGSGPPCSQTWMAPCLCGSLAWVATSFLACAQDIAPAERTPRLRSLPAGADLCLGSALQLQQDLALPALPGCHELPHAPGCSLGCTKRHGRTEGCFFWQSADLLSTSHKLLGCLPPQEKPPCARICHCHHMDRPQSSFSQRSFLYPDGMR